MRRLRRALLAGVLAFAVIFSVGLLASALFTWLGGQPLDLRTPLIFGISWGLFFALTVYFPNSWLGRLNRRAKRSSR